MAKKKKKHKTQKLKKNFLPKFRSSQSYISICVYNTTKKPLQRLKITKPKRNFSQKNTQHTEKEQHIRGNSSLDSVNLKVLSGWRVWLYYVAVGVQFCVRTKSHLSPHSSPYFQSQTRKSDTPKITNPENHKPKKSART